MKLIVIKALRCFYGRELIRWINRQLRRLLFFTHYIQFMIEWGSRPVPGWFDHYIDLNYLWHKSRTPLSWERGIFSLLAIKADSSVLELCCGDGFNAYYFYSIRAHQIIAVDIDEEAIKTAKKNYPVVNVDYRVADIRTQMPVGQFDNIVWDASLEYFSEVEIANLMMDIQSRLGLNGILSGFSIVQDTCQIEHKYIFRSKQDLIDFLSIYFKFIRVFETIYPSRHNLYFYASNHAIEPFDTNWISNNS